jgi:hypothetical protein
MPVPGAGVSIEAIERILEIMQGEVMQLVGAPPESLRSEFGFGRATGHLMAMERFRVLLNEDLEAQARKEEEFEKEF